MPKVSNIITYPVKSCQGIWWIESPVNNRGLLYDRAFMIVDEDGRMMTQREYPRMCLISVGQPETHLAVLGFPDVIDGAVISLTGRHDGEEMIVSVWKDSILAYDQGDHAAQWLENCLGTPCRLVRMANDEVRKTRLGEGQVGFADGYPFLGISEASLDDLNGRMKSPIPLDRFRPNIVFEGCEPFAEDHWRRIRIGNVELVGETLCARCNIPTINQATAVGGKEPSATLAKYRRVKHLLHTPEWKTPYPASVYFGRNFNVASTGLIKVGMEVEVLEED